MRYALVRYDTISVKSTSALRIARAKIIYSAIRDYGIGPDIK